MKMPLFVSSSPFDADVEKATSEMNTVEDWGRIMDICDKVKTTSNGAKDCLRSIVKRLNHRVPFVSMQALTLLNACVNNCGRDFHLEICSRDFISECRTLIGQKAHPRVAQKLRFMIKNWAEMKDFKDDPACSLIPQFYESLKKEGHEFADPDSTPKKTAAVSKDPNVASSQQEEDDIAKAIALSLKEEEKSSSQKTTGLYPAGFSAGSSGGYQAPRTRDVRKVRALYDFEAVEDNELTFYSGELISVLDDSDPNWWKGFNQRGEGLFPANFVTADLTVEPEATKKKVEFSEEVQVQTIETPEQVEIDEEKIDNMLQMIQNADPTGENRPDTVEMLQLEEQCKQMGPLIDAELEKVDKKHADLCAINTKVLEALQMYHNLMKETPIPYAYKQSMSGYNQSMMGMPPGSVPQQFSGSQYIPQGGQYGGPQMPPMSQGQVPPMSQMGPMPQGQGHMMQGPGPQQQSYTTSSQNYNGNASGQPSYNPAQSLHQQPHPQQNVVPSQTSISTPHMNVLPSNTQYGQNVGPAGTSTHTMVPSSSDYRPQGTFQGHVYQQPVSQHQLL